MEVVISMKKLKNDDSLANGESPSHDNVMRKEVGVSLPLVGETSDEKIELQQKPTYLH